MRSELQWYPSMVPVINGSTRRNQYFARVSLSYPVSLFCVKRKLQATIAFISTGAPILRDVTQTDIELASTLNQTIYVSFLSRLL